MLESLRRSVGLQLARLHFRKRRDEVVSFTSSVSGARHALLIMPLGHNEVLPVVTILDLLKRKFNERDVTVISSGPNLELMQMLPHSQFIRVLDTEITPFYLPRRQMLERVNRMEYDLAIDLNLDFVLPSGYICRESNARVRVGFVGRQSDVFYNFLIHADPSPGTPRLYDRLAACLEMF